MLWLILLFALLLRLPLLGGSFWLDEAAQALESIRPFAQQLDIVPDFQPPLLHYLVHFAAQVSVAEWWLRLWGALIPGLITIYLTYQLGKKLFSEQVAIVTGLLLATSSFHIFYSQELRPYSLPAMWGMLGTWLLFKKDFKWWQFALVSAAGLYSSYLYPFLLLPQLWLVWRQHGRPAMIKAGVVAAATFAPWLPMFFQQLQAGQLLREQVPGWEHVVSTPQLKALGLVFLKFVYGVSNLTVSWFYAGSLMVVLFAAVLSWYRYPNQKHPLWKNWRQRLVQWFQSKQTKIQTERAQQILWLFALPLLASWLISFAVPVIQPKRLLFLLPFFYLLATIPLSSAKTPKSLAWLLPAVLLIMNLFSNANYWTSPALQRENWRDLKAQLVADFPAADTIAVFAFDEPFAPWRWYQPEALPSISLGQRQVGTVDDLTGTLRPISDYRYVLLFDYLRDLTDPANQLEPAIESFGFEGRGVIDYPGIGFVRIYTRPTDALGYQL